MFVSFNAEKTARACCKRPENEVPFCVALNLRGLVLRAGMQSLLLTFSPLYLARDLGAKCCTPLWQLKGGGVHAGGLKYLRTHPDARTRFG